MKRPQPDLEQVTRGGFISTVGAVRKLKRYWGTTTVDGVEVLKKRQYYQPSGWRLPDKDFEKLMRYLGTYEDLKNSSSKGLHSAWLYFNKNELGGDLVDAPQFVADNLNLTFWDPNDGEAPEGLTLTTTIVIDRLLSNPRGAGTTPLLNSSMLEPEMIQVITDNYETLWDTCLIRQEGVGVINKGSYTDPVTLETVQDEDDLSPNDPWLDVISLFALRDNSVPCTVKGVRRNINNVAIPGRYLGGGSYIAPYSALYSTYEVTIEIPMASFSPGNIIVNDIASEITATYSKKTSASNGFYLQKVIKAMSSEDVIDEENTGISRPYTSWDESTLAGDPRFDAIWKDGHLIADVFINPKTYNIKYSELSRYVFGSLDSGHKKKKVKKWKKVVAAIIFIIAVVVTFITAGGASPLVAAAYAVLVGALVLAVLALAASALGHDEWAMAFSHISKEIEPLVTVASIILIVTAPIDTLIRMAILEAVDVVLQELGIDFDIAKDLIGLAIGGGDPSSLVAALNAMVKLINMSERNKLDSIASRNNDLLAQYADLQQEMSREYDVLRGFSNVYTKPATADWSMYASTYDLPYERGGGPLSMGNIQRTTKQALRKGTYNDPAFDNILVV